MHKRHGHAVPSTARSRLQPKTNPILLAPGDVAARELLDKTSPPLPSGEILTPYKVVLDFWEKMEKMKNAVGVYGTKSSTARVC